MAGESGKVIPHRCVFRQASLCVHSIMKEPDAAANVIGYATFSAGHAMPSFAFTMKLAT